MFLLIHLYLIYVVTFYIMHIIFSFLTFAVARNIILKVKILNIRRIDNEKNYFSITDYGIYFQRL